MASGSRSDEVVVPSNCQYPNRKCHQAVIPTYNYCLRHILEDKNAPFRPCSFTYPNTNKKCPLAAPKGDKRDTGYCQMHLWRLLLKRQKSSAKNMPPMTTESLLTELSHYVRPVRNAWNKNPSNEKQDPNVTTALNPFVEVDVSKAWLRRAHVLECASESDSDIEPATLDNVCHAQHEESSDAESIDSQMDDPLRYSGVYTAEEAALLARNKMMRLQMLYQKQFDKIITTLKEKRRIYLATLKKEKEALCSIADQTKNSAKDRKTYDKLKALHRYHRKSNRETIAYLSSIDKRSRQNGVVKPVGSKCTYTEGGVRCCGPTLPLTKFCFKHILQDTNQCVFRACGCVKADSLCQEPVIDLTGDEACLLHYKLPSLPHLPSTSNDDYCNPDPEKAMEGESELDASATESAVSTDNGISNEETVHLETQSIDHDEKSELCANGNRIDSSQSIDAGYKSNIKSEVNIKKEPLYFKHEMNVRQSPVLKTKQDKIQIKQERMPIKLESVPIKQEVKESPLTITDHISRTEDSKMEFSMDIEGDDTVIEETVVEDEYVVVG